VPGDQPAEDGTAWNGNAPAIRWVGEQRLMQGYCGRAVVADPATAAEESGQPEALAPRTVVLLQRPRGQVVRIGPRSPVQDDCRTARAA
jgi:hypothetical protein